MSVSTWLGSFSSDSAKHWSASSYLPANAQISKEQQKTAMLWNFAITIAGDNAISLSRATWNTRPSMYRTAKIKTK